MRLVCICRSERAPMPPGGPVHGSVVARNLGSPGSGLCSSLQRKILIRAATVRESVSSGLRSSDESSVVRDGTGGRNFAGSCINSRSLFHSMTPDRLIWLTNIAPSVTSAAVEFSFIGLPRKLPLFMMRPSALSDVALAGRRRRLPEPHRKLQHLLGHFICGVRRRLTIDNRVRCSRQIGRTSTRRCTDHEPCA